MASDHGPPESELTEAIVTCEGNLHDPDFSTRFQSLLDKLKAVLYKSKKEELIKVRKIEPWNSVRVTISIPKEAAQRLRQLAQQGSTVLRQLGILSVQVEGDQVISLTLAGKNGNEAQQVVLQQNVPGSSHSSSFTPNTFLSNLVPSGISNSSSSTNQPTPPGTTQQFIFQQSSAGHSSGFRIPNVVAPSPGESLPVIPPVKPGTTGNPQRLNHGGPFPFASMTHAVHTMQRVETVSSSSGGSSPVSIPSSSSPSPQNVSVVGGGSKSTNFLSVTTQPTPSGTPTGIPIVQLQGQPGTHGTLLLTQPPNNNAPAPRFIYSNSSNSVNVSSTSAISQATAATAAVVVSSSSSQSLQIQFVNVNSSNSSSTPYSQSITTAQPQSLQFKFPQSGVSGSQTPPSSVPGDRPVSSPLLVNLLQHGDTNGSNSSSPTHPSQQPRTSMPPPPLSLSVESPKVKRYQLLQQQRKLKRGMSLDTSGLGTSPTPSPTLGAFSEPASPSDCTTTNINLTSVEGQRTLTIYPSQQQGQGNFRMPQTNQQLNQSNAQQPQLVLRQQTTNQLSQAQHIIQQNQQIQMVQQQTQQIPNHQQPQQNQVLHSQQQQSSQPNPQNQSSPQVQQYQLHIQQPQMNQRLQQPQFQLQIQQQPVQVQKQTPQGQTITQQQIIHLQQPQQYQIQGHHIRATGVRFVQQQQQTQNPQFVTLTTSNSQQLHRQVRPQQFINSNNQGSVNVNPPTLVNSNPPARAQYTMLISSSQTTSSQQQHSFTPNLTNIPQQSQLIDSNQQQEFSQPEQPDPQIQVQPKLETEQNLQDSLHSRLQPEQTDQLSEDLGAKLSQSKLNSNETYTKGTFLAPNAPPPRLLSNPTKPLVKTVPSQIPGGKKPFGKKDSSNPLSSPHTSPGKPLFLINPLTGHLEPMSNAAAASVLATESSESEEEPDGQGKKGVKKRKPKANKADIVIGGAGAGKPMSVVSFGKPLTGSPGKSGPPSTEKIKLRLKIEKNETGHKELPVLTPVSAPNTPTSASTEPRVPPLHISIRGKNSAVVVSPRRDDLGLADLVNCDLTSNLLGGSVSDKSKTKSGSKSKPGKLTRPRTSNEELMSDSMPYVPGKIRHKSASLSNENLGVGDLQLSNANIITTPSSQNKSKKKKKSDSTNPNSTKPPPVIRVGSEKCSITSTLDDLLESINRENDEQEKLEAAMALAKDSTSSTFPTPLPLPPNSSSIEYPNLVKPISPNILSQPPAILLADDDDLKAFEADVEEPEKVVRIVDEMRLGELEINVRNMQIDQPILDTMKTSLTEVDSILPSPSPIIVSLPPMLETVIPSKLPDDQLSTNGSGSTGLPGEDSGIDSMDALSEKSPNNVHSGESPARKESVENNSSSNPISGSPVPPPYNSHDSISVIEETVLPEKVNTILPPTRNEVLYSLDPNMDIQLEDQIKSIPESECLVVPIPDTSFQIEQMKASGSFEVENIKHQEVSTVVSNEEQVEKINDVSDKVPMEDTNVASNTEQMEDTNFVSNSEQTEETNDVSNTEQMVDTNVVSNIEQMEVTNVEEGKYILSAQEQHFIPPDVSVETECPDNLLDSKASTNPDVTDCKSLPHESISSDQTLFNSEDINSNSKSSETIDIEVPLNITEAEVPTIKNECVSEINHSSESIAEDKVLAEIIEPCTVNNLNTHSVKISNIVVEHTESTKIDLGLPSTDNDNNADNSELMHEDQCFESPGVTDEVKVIPLKIDEDVTSADVSKNTEKPQKSNGEIIEETQEPRPQHVEETLKPIQENIQETEKPIIENIEETDKPIMETIVETEKSITDSPNLKEETTILNPTIVVKPVVQYVNVKQLDVSNESEKPEPFIEDNQTIIKPSVLDKTCTVSNEQPFETDSENIEVETVSFSPPVIMEPESIQPEPEVNLTLSIENKDNFASQDQNEIPPHLELKTVEPTENELLELSTNPEMHSSIDDMPKLVKEEIVLESCDVIEELKKESSELSKVKNIVSYKEESNTTLPVSEPKKVLTRVDEVPNLVTPPVTPSCSKPIPNLHPITEFNSIPVSVLPRFEPGGHGTNKTIPPIIRPQIVHMQHNTPTSMVHLPHLVRPNAGSLPPPQRHLVRPIPPLSTPKSEEVPVPGGSSNIFHLTQDAHGNFLTLTSQPQTSTIMQDAHGNILQLNRAHHGFPGNLIQISAAPTQVTGSVGVITGPKMITIPANLSHHLHSQVNSPLAVLPSGRKVLPVKLVSIPAKQTVGTGQTTGSTNLRSSPTILEAVNISSRSGSPHLSLQGKSIQVQTIPPNLTLVPISLPSVTSTTGSGTGTGAKLLGLQQLKMSTSCPSNMVVMTSNASQTGTCIRVVRPGGIALAGYKKEQLQVKSKHEPSPIKSPTPTPTISSIEEGSRPVAIVSAFKTSTTPVLDDNKEITNHSNELSHTDGEDEVEGDEEEDEDLPLELQADIIHDEKDLEAALAATNETRPPPIVQQNGIHDDEIPDIREDNTTVRDNKLRLTPTSDSPPNLYPSYSRSPSPSSASDIHGEDQEIINTFAKSSDHTYGRSRSSSKLKQMEELSIEIPAGEDEAGSEHSSASSVRQQPVRSTRSNTRLLSPDITAFTPSARSETPKHHNQLHPQQPKYRNSPKPSPTGSKDKSHSPNIGSPQHPIAGSSARSSPILPNCGSSGAASPVVSKANAGAKSSKRKRRESDDSSSTTSKDDNSLIEEAGKLIDLNSRPSKRRCSENAAELIKACIGVDETYKRLPPSGLTKDNSKAKDNKGKKLLLSVVSEETDDELEASAVDHLLRGKAGSGRSSRGSSEDRSSSRGSSVNRQTVLPSRAIEEKEPKPNTRVTNHRAKANAKGNNSPQNHNANSVPSNNKKKPATKLIVKDPATKKSKSPLNSKAKAVNATKKDVTPSTATLELPKVVTSVNVTPSTGTENSRRKTRSSATGRIDAEGSSTFKRRRISKDTTIKTS